MKNSNKKTIAMALLISAVINPVGKEAFAAEPTPTELSGNQENTSDVKITEQPSGGPDTSGEDSDVQPVEGATSSSIDSSDTTQDDQKTEDVTDGDGPQTLEEVEPTIKPYAVSETPTNAQSHRLHIKYGNAQSWEFYKYKPEDPENAIKLGDYDNVEEGYLVKGVIKMKPWYILDSNGLEDIPKDKYTVAVEGEGQNAVVTYTFTGIEMNKAITIDASNGNKIFNYASFNLDGGTWNDSNSEFNRKNFSGNNYGYLTPGKTLYEPEAPTKEGYIFRGWEGSSTLTSPTNIKSVTTYTKDNPYRFDEVYPVDPEYQEGRQRVSLKAIWERDENVEILGKHEFKYTKPDTVEEIYFKATNPDNPSESIEIPIDNAKVGESVPLTEVPAGWKLEGQIKMKPNYLIYGTGDSNLPITDFERTAEGGGDQRRWVYTLPDGYKMPNTSVDLRAWQFEQFNHADFDLNGGKWDQIPDGFKKYNDSNEYYTLILPQETVRRPKDPKRDGYEFIGWSGRSKLTQVEGKQVTKVFTAENPYTFDEEDNLPAVGVERLKIVKLKAEWVKNPDIELKNIEILVGDNYNLKDLIDKVTVTDNNITKELNEANGDYTVDFEYDSIDNNKPGTYPVDVIITTANGGKARGKAFVIVKEKQSTLNEPEGETKEVFVGDEVPEAKSFVKDFENLPERTEVAFKETPSTETAGEYEVKLTVTYPDGTTDEVVGKLIVKAKPNTPDLPKKDEPGTSDNKDEDEKVVVPSPDEDKPELPSTENTVTPDKSEESEEPGTPDKTEDSDDIEESGEQETTDGKDDGDKVVVPTPDNEKPEDSEESGTTDKSETPDESEEFEGQDTTDKKDDDGKIRVPSINRDNEPDDRHSSSKINQSSESSIISVDNNKERNITRSPRSGHDNVQTGVSGAIGVASILAAASLGLAATKKKEDEEE